MKKCVLLSFFLLLSLSTKLSAAIVYVNGSYSGSTENGLSWATPFKTIEAALAAASPEDQIWVAKGIYIAPYDPVAPNMIQGYHIDKNISLYGSFEGTETSVFERDLRNDSTLVQNNLNGSGGGYTVFSVNTNVHVLFDGFGVKNFSNGITQYYDDPSTNTINVTSDDRFNIKINNCVFSDGYMPLWFQYFGNLEVSNSIFSVRGTLQTSQDRLPNDGTSDVRSNFKFTNVTFTNNRGPSFRSSRTHLEFLKCHFLNNQASSVQHYVSGNVSFKDCDFDRNVADIFAGFNYVLPSKLTVDGCTFHSTGISVGVVAFRGDGLSEVLIVNSTFDAGANTTLQSDASKIIFDNVSVTNYNIPFGNFVSYSVPNGLNKKFIIKNSRFENNNCSSGGSTVFSLAGSGLLLEVTNSTFKNNSTTGTGVLSFTGGGASIDNCLFEGNVTNYYTGAGAMYLSLFGGTEPFSINNCKFLNNIGTRNGGALLLAAPATIKNSSFIGNKATAQNADMGGAIASILGYNVQVENTVFESNESPYAGAVYCSSGTWTFNACKFKNNSSVNAGAIRSFLGSVKVYNSLFDGNICTATSNWMPTAPTLVLINEIGVNHEVKNCTFVNNKNYMLTLPNLGGEVIWGVPKIISNCIFWNNGNRLPLTTSEGYYASIKLESCNIQGGFPFGENILDVDPQFADFSGGNYHLTCSSPLINQGNNEYAYSSTDLDGATRIFAGQVDIGAYEFPQDPATGVVPPQVAFNVPSSACRSELLTFQNTTVPQAGVRFEWDFGDGVTTQVVSPTHQYPTAGTYIVKLKATNACGAFSEVTQEVTINATNAPSISYVTLVCPGQTSTFFTNATCSNLQWTIEGGTLVSGNGTSTISVLWGDGSLGNGKVTLLATGCGSGLCETPVSIAIPIVPVNFELQGPDALCQGATGVYETKIKDQTPSTIYTWTAKGGQINGLARGYNLNTVSVRWGNTTKGVIYLNTYSELLECGRLDSIEVELRPQFSITGTDKVCTGSTESYYPTVAANYAWTVSGSNTVNSTTGQVTWGSTSGEYQLIAEVLDADQTCNTKDTLIVKLFSRPTISEVLGANEILPNSNQTYTVVSDLTSGVQYNWQITNGYVTSSFADKANVVWSASSPYQLSVTATRTEGSCASTPYVFNVGPDFVYTISGPDTVCIGTTGTFTSTSDPNHSEQFTWTSSFTLTQASANNYDVTFDLPGSQYVNVKVIRNGKEYNAYRSVYVKAAPTDIAITGRLDIDPAGLGTYDYIVRNSQNLAYNYTVIGASNTVKNGNTLTVTWGGVGPFEITAIGIVPGNVCTGVPATITVKKAPNLSTQISSQGSPCVNSRVKYTYLTDNLASNLSWSVSAGGTIISNAINEIIVEWATTGNHVVTFQYDRFGIKTFNLNVDVKPLPSPAINTVKICGSNPVALSTSTSFSAYKWFAEPNNVSFSSAAQPMVSVEGQYRVEATDANGCVAFASKYIEQTPLPRVKIFSNEDFNYCKQTPGALIPITLKTYEGQDYHYQWYANGSPVGADLPTYNTSVSTANQSSVLYTVRVTLQTCSETSPATAVNVNVCGGGGGNPCNDPAVSFTASPNNGCPPFTFNNTSSPGTGQFGWTFGDGTSSNLPTPPSKQYSDVGIFNIYLTRGCQAHMVKVEVPGVALFKVDAPGCKGQSLSFNELSVNIPGSPIVGWKWDVSDGFSTGRLSGLGSRDFSHPFVNSGTYTVTLTVFTQNEITLKECSSTFSKEITVTAPPVANFTISPPPCTDNTYKFIDQSTFLYSKAKYLWDFGNGNTSTLFDPSQRLAAGTQNIKLEVTDLLGCKNSITKSQVVLTPNEVGKIVITGDTTLCNGKSVTLTSPLGSTYVWKKNGVIIPNTTQSITTTDPGSYTVDYSVPGCVVTTLAVNVKNYSVPNLLSGNKKVCVGDAMSIQTNLDASKYAFAWKFNTTDLTATGTELLINNVQLTTTGNYTVTVTDKLNGCIVSLPAYDITAYNKPAKPVITPSQVQSCYDGVITLSVPVSATGNTFTWYKEQDVIAGATTPSIVLSNITTVNNYSLKLTDDNSGCSILTDKQLITVAPKIIVNVTGDELSCEYTAVSFGTQLSTTDFDFQWFKNGIAAGPNNTKYSFTSVLLADAGDYYVTVTSKGTTNITGCQAKSDTLTLVIKAGPTQPVISGPSAFCTGSPITLSSNLTNNISWNTGAVTSSILVTLGGTYTVTSTNPLSGCAISASKTVTQNPLPDLSFFPPGIYERCASDRLSFEGLDIYPIYAWYVDGQLYETKNKMYPTKTGKYTLTVTTDKGCVANSDTIRFISLKCPCYVTNTDDDGVGSLREAIECSNAKYGRDYIDFAIPGTGPFVIQPITALPVLSDSVVIEGFTQSGPGVYSIVIDGSLYDKNALVVGQNLPYNDISGLTFRNFKNAISVSSYVSYSSIDSNVFVNNQESAIELKENAHHNLVAENSITSSGDAVILVGNTNYNRIHRNTIANSKNGLAVFGGSSYNDIRFNLISQSNKNGIWLNAASSENTLSGNTLLSSTLDGIYINDSDNNTIDTNFIGVQYDGVVAGNLVNGIHLNGTSASNKITRNLIGRNGQHGILTASVGQNTIESNFIGLTNTGNSIGNTKYGIYVSTGKIIAKGNRIANHAEYGVYLAGSSVLVANTINENMKGGVYVTNDLNKISKTTFTNTNAAVKAIDLHAAVLPAGNTAKLPAVFTKYRRAASGGVILKGTALAGDTVELFINDNTAQQALRYIGYAKADAAGVFEIEIPLGTSFDPNQKNYYVNTATDALGNTSELSQPFMIGCFTCICTVSNTNDSGAGSLRGEVDNANTGGCLTINFSIATPDSISILSPISDIIVPLTINGTQGGIDPLIFVKGNGLFDAFRISADGVNINNLGLTAFKHAITVSGDYSTFTQLNVVKTVRPVKIEGSYNTLTASDINTYSSKTSTYSTDTLVYITGNNNQIGKVNEGNRIVNAAKFGVLVSGGVNNSILFNEIFDNTLAIAHIVNGNNLQPVPYNMVGSSVAGVSSVTGKAKPLDRVQFFMSTYDPEQAYTYAEEVYADAAGNFTVIIPSSLIVPNVNNYVVATATDALGNTSPLSPPVRIGNFVQVCYVKNTLDSGKESLRDAVNCANLAGISGVPARIEFQLPSTPNEIVVSSGFTVTNNYGVKINPFGTPVSIKAQSNTLVGFTWATNGFEIKNLTFDNFASALYCQGSNALIDSNQFINNTLGIAINASGPAVMQTITNNFFANGAAAIRSEEGSLVIQKNKIGTKKDGTAGAISEFGISIENATSVDIRENSIENIGVGANPLTPAAYKGIPLYINNSRGQLVDNTIQGTGINNAALHLVQFLSSDVTANHIGKAKTGVWIENSLSTTFFNNDLKQVTEIGFDAVQSNSIMIAQNTVEGLQLTGKPIELHLNTPASSNSNIPTPNIISATFHDGLLFLIGESVPLDYIELFYSDVEGNDLDQYVLNTSADSAGVWIASLPIAAADAKNYYFKATARNTDRRTSEASGVFNPELKICLVTTNADNVTGSLREAIDKANLNTCNLIQFDISPAGLSTIEPVSDLPLITATQLIVDATSQPGYVKGSPTIELLDNSTQSHAFSTLGTDQFNVYGIRISGYDTSIAITNAKIVELNDNVLTNFVKAGIGMKTTVFKYGNIKMNNISSTGENGIALIGSNGIVLDTNTISGISQYGIYTEGVNQKLLRNAITAGNTTTAVGIALKNGSDSYLFKNEVKKAYRGITIINGARHRVNSNVMGTLNPAAISAGTIINESAIFMDHTHKTVVYRNEVNGSQNGVYVQNSFKPTVQNTKAKKVSNKVINIIDCDSAIVNFNTLDSVNTGIYVLGSGKTYIQGNNISSIVDYGIFLDTGSDTCLLHANNVGAEYVGSKNYSSGEGLRIKSSYNKIGGFDDEDSINTFFHNKKGGIVVDGGKFNSITYNVFFENDISLGRPTALAIAHTNTGNNNKAKPVIADHEYIGKELYLYGTGAALDDSVHVYLGEGGYEEARLFMGSGRAVAGGAWTVIVDSAHLQRVKPNSTLYLVSTATDLLKNTSPLSKMYILGDCYVTSLKDTTDNEYPMPNSLRMAVNCANGQKSHVGVFFNVDKYGDKDVELQMKLQAIQNPYGVTFNARNITTDNLRGGIDGSKLIIPADTLWTIERAQGASSFDSLHVENCKNGILVLADSITINGFDFENNSNRAISARSNADSLVVSASSFRGTVPLSLTSVGVALDPGAKFVSLLDNEFGGLQTAVLAISNDTLTVDGNKFGVVLGDTVSSETSLSIQNAVTASVTNNTFVSRSSTNQSLVWDNSTGSVNTNTFAAHKAVVPVEFKNSTGFNIRGNNFVDSALVYLTVNNSHVAEITGNSFQRADGNTIKVNGSDSIQIKYNQVDRVVQDAFDINASTEVFISRNTVRNVRYNNTIPKDTALCINIHKGETNVANYGKQEPTDLHYSIKLGTDKRRGLFVQGTAEPGDSVEVFFSDSLSASMNKYLVTGYADMNGLWEVRIPRKEYHKDTVTWYHAIAVAISADSNTSKTSSVLHIPPVFDVFYVRNDYDNGANSLRDALLQVNASDLASRVVFQIDYPEFQPGPYHIKLDSLLDPIYSYLGYVKDGNTQIGYGAGEDQRIIVEAGKIDTAYVFNLVDSSDVCEMRNIWFNDARLGVRIANNENKIENFHFLSSDATVRLDTAFVVTGNENEVKNLEIHNYNTGVLLTEGAGENKIIGSRIDSATIAVIASDSAYKNIVNKSLIYNTSQIAFLADSAAADNVFTNNSIGAPGKPATGIAAKVNNSNSQTFTYNRIAVIDPYADGSLSSAFLITGNSAFNYFFGNKVGIDSLSQVVHPADMRGFTIMPSTDGTPETNTILGNEISGMNWAAIYAESTTGGLIGENLIGTDSLRIEHGIDSSGIVLKNCTNMETSDNVIFGFKIDGISLVSSDNIRMNRNIIHSTLTNNKGINIHAGTPEESNGGLLFPVITQGILVDTQTVRLSGTSKPNVVVEVYESVKDTMQSVAYVNKVFAQSDATGAWTIDVPREYFSFAKENCYVAQNHEGLRSSEFSASYKVQPLLCQLAASNPPIQILDPLYTPCPGPAFVLDAGLDEGLTYKWKSDAWDDTIRTKKASMTESAPNLKLFVSDDFGCTLNRSTNVVFKARPINPDFIVSSEVYAGDTIVLVDISLPVPTEYTWFSSPGVTILRGGTVDSLNGDDGNVYPVGTRFIEFILPDSGSYNITQKSLRDGCKVELKKDLNAKPKNPNDDKPYFVAPEIQSLSAYPNPSKGTGVVANVKVASKGEVTLYVIDNQGAILSTIELSGKTTYNVTLPDIQTAGMYHLKLVAGEKQIVFKLIVTK